ncbi:MAG: hypothetical protein OXF63_09135, partial [Anaerolineaceae bacterium]|nr:hypothetical protein [Anaerolineaceae bacterium]
LAAATYQNALWDRIRAALNQLAAEASARRSDPPPPEQEDPPPERQEPQVDAGLLAEVEAKIARHRETGRADLEAGFSKVRDGLLGKISPDDALDAIKSGWNNDLWNRIRAALEAMKG